MNYLLQLTKISKNLKIINITCLSSPSKFVILANEKCLSKNFSIEEECNDLDRYYKFLTKKTLKRHNKLLKN